ncbi:hypothetical protein [Streptomyces lydicus]|uniref:hypothetical protein n=1 Tax=Streptomyces lydicus TaxID=47763 RepID=UPI003787B989
MTAAKRRGTAWETLAVNYLKDHHNPRAHRNVQMGAKDIGDLDGYYLHAVENKDEQTLRFSAYIDQARREAGHAGQPFGVAFVKRRRKGVADGYAVRDLETDVRLINRLRDAEQIAQQYAPADVWKTHYEAHGEGR